MWIFNITSCHLLIFAIRLINQASDIFMRLSAVTEHDHAIVELMIYFCDYNTRQAIQVYLQETVFNIPLLHLLHSILISRGQQKLVFHNMMVGRVTIV